MISRIALILFVAGAPLVLSSCGLAKGIPNMMGRTFNTAVRGFGVENTRTEPFRWDSREIEKARGMENETPLLPEHAAEAKDVAAR